MDEAVLAAVRAHPRGVETAAVCRTLGQTPQALGDAFERLKGSGKLLGFAGLWIAPDHLEAALRSGEPLDWPEKPALRLRDHLARRGQTAPTRLPKAQREALDRLVALYAEAAPGVPNGRELAHALRLPPPGIQALVRLGLETGALVDLGDGAIYAAAGIPALTERLRGITRATDARDRLGVSRRLAIALLRWRDQTKG